MTRWLTNPLGIALIVVMTACAGWAQDTSQAPPAEQRPAPQYPPSGQYPYPQTQAPPRNQYPGPGQYPPAQNQYPPQPQNQYPQPQQSQAPYPQYPQGPPPQYPPPTLLSPQQLDQLVGPVALYPDGLLAQVLAAATFSNQVPDAAGWANAHQYLKGDQLAAAIRADDLNFDPSIMALLPFPSVLNYMAQYMGWTQALGNAVLTQREQVMDATQRLRQEAYNYGYLQNNQYVHVIAAPGAIEILPLMSNFYYVPYYNPIVVFRAPSRPDFFVGGARRFGGGFTVGAAFAPWGWSSLALAGVNIRILVDNRPWARTRVRSALSMPIPMPRRIIGAGRASNVTSRARIAGTKPVSTMLYVLNVQDESGSKVVMLLAMFAVSGPRSF